MLCPYKRCSPNGLVIAKTYSRLQRCGNVALSDDSVTRRTTWPINRIEFKELTALSTAGGPTTLMSLLDGKSSMILFVTRSQSRRFAHSRLPRSTETQKQHYRPSPPGEFYSHLQELESRKFLEFSTISMQWRRTKSVTIFWLSSSNPTILKDSIHNLFAASSSYTHFSYPSSPTYIGFSGC